MSTLLKSLGALILLIGVGVLAFFSFTATRDNMILGVGLTLVIVGFLAHIFLNKVVDDKYLKEKVQPLLPPKEEVEAQAEAKS
ncbi:MAG: hypothetical protein LBR84_03395 [Tannerella sp.]|jgi:uncharacterized membrane protein HdeD (DUF308 family)|nr:hypothetical protein [Tannerella sp.]